VGEIATLLAFGSFFTAAALLVLIGYYSPRAEPTATTGEGTSSPAPETRIDSTDRTVLPDDEMRRRAIGVWTDTYRGERTMTLREDGTATMVVVPAGLAATLFAERLQFEMTWDIQEGRIIKKTTGGEPADKVRVIVKALGDRVEEEIQELTRERLVLVDQNGTTTYQWTRTRTQ
jgi:hypothetical protein